MQTGAFLQLILTLSALVCRLRTLTQVLLEIDEELRTTLADLCDSLEVRFANFNPSGHLISSAGLS